MAIDDESGRTLLDLTVKPSHGQAPLETAAASSECLSTELLLANGTTLTGSDAIQVVLDVAGKTALEIAAEEGRGQAPPLGLAYDLTVGLYGYSRWYTA